MEGLEAWETCKFYVMKNPFKETDDYNVYSVTNDKVMGWMVREGDGFRLKIMKYAIKYCGEKK